MSSALIPNRTQASAPLSEDLFQSLVSEWNHATAFTSNLTEVIEHPAFRRIVAMGNDAVPFLLRELKKKPSFWSSLSAKSLGKTLYLSARGGKSRR